MAYEVMTPKSDGDSISARDWNQIVDNFIAGVPDLMTTKGDLVAASGADAATRVAVGNDGYNLAAVTGGELKWKYKYGRYGAGLSKDNPATSGTFADDTWTAISFATELWDTENANVLDGSGYMTFTAPDAGYYLVIGQILFQYYPVDEYVSGYQIKIGIQKNGSGIAAVMTGWQNYASHAADYGYVLVDGMDIIYLDADDTVKLMAYGNGNTSLAWRIAASTAPIRAFVSRLG